MLVLFLGPQRPPVIKTAFSRSSDSISISWERIPLIYQGAYFNGYNVQHYVSGSNLTHTKEANSTQLKLLLTNLMGLTTYEIKVCGFGWNATGPCSKKSVRTLEGGMIFRYHLI